MSERLGFDSRGIFDATGLRLRSLPMVPNGLKHA